MIRQIAKCIREYKKDSFLSMFFVVLEVIMECLIPYYMSFLLNEIQKFGAVEEMFNMNEIIMYSSILVAMAFLSLIFGVMSGKFCARASAGLAKNVRHDLFKKINEFSFSNIDKYSTSSLVTRMTSDISYVQMAFMMIIRTAVRAPIMLVFSVIMAFMITPDLAWIFVVVIPFLLLGLGLIMRIALPTFRRIFKKYDKLNESVQENIAGIRTVKSFVREEYEKNKFGVKSDDVRKDFTHAERIVALNSPVFNFAIYAVNVVIIFLGGSIIINTASNPIPSMQIGDLSALMVYGIQSLMSLMMLSMIFVMLIMSIESTRRICEVLNEVPTIKQNSFNDVKFTKLGMKNPRKTFKTIFDQELNLILNHPEQDGIKEVKNGDVEFKNVSFKYDIRAEQFALKDISLNVKSGEIVGILGSTGSSKSTLVNLISRLYDVTEGEVKVGDINVKDYDLKVLRDSVSVVLQKNLLFKGTIKENLRWGNEFATDEEMREACKLACADDFIQDFKDKYDHMIEQGGTNVSGGQKQRLCIARAILKRPKILIMDDSTSAVDTKTDAKIRREMRSYLPDTTKFIIAQRVSSIIDANKIIIMNNGTIEDIGTHSELLKRNEMYQDLYYSQNKHVSKDIMSVEEVK